MALSLALRSRFISNLNRIVYPIISSSNRNVSNNPKSVYKTEEAKKIRFYILNQFIEFVKNYDKVLEKNFPVTWKTYKVFTEGIRLFIGETREYFRIVKVLNSPGGNYAKLLRREIELYEQMPKDMMKVAPVLVFSTLPFAFYVLLPLVYALPKQVLTSHFWTLEQKYNFGLENLRSRLLHNKPVLRHLQSQLPYIKRCESDKTVVYEWDKVLGYLGSGAQPRVEDVLACKELFMDEPYHLLYLSRNHIYHLLKIHNIHIGWFRRTRLADRALILIEMDKAIMREGGVHNLPLDALRKSCYLRGLNPTSLSTEYMIKWMKQWIQISSQIDKDNLSLLLHCPILFGYNEPTNWRLIYPIK